MKIGDNQIKLLNLAKNYLEKTASIGVDISESGFCWLLNVPANPGYFILKNLHDNKTLNIKNIFLIFKYFVSISILHNYKLLSKD